MIAPMVRHFAVVALLLLAACATGEDDGGPTMDSGPAKTDSGSSGDSSVADTAPADTNVPDTSVADTAVADTALADTNLPDTSVADTVLADTVVADTLVADTLVADTSVADTLVADTTTGDGGACSGTVVDWNWNTGTGPATLIKSSPTSLWSVGAATAGPKDSLSWLATNPGGNYVNGMSEWVQLPTIDLSAHGGCKVRVTVALWRNCEGSVSNRDGGNLQYNVDPTATTGWKVMDGVAMAYDGALSTLGCSTGCALYDQPTWSSTQTPYAKTAVFTSSAPLGASLALRFTFFSDGSLSSYPGLYVKSLRVEAVP